MLIEQMWQTAADWKKKLFFI